MWRAPATLRERLSSFGVALLIVIPLLVPVSVLVGKIHSQGGLVWNNELAALDATLPLAKSARETYRSYLLSRNSGFETTARSELFQAERELAEAIAQLEGALAAHRRADGTFPPRFANYLTVLERLRFYHGNTRRAADALRRQERGGPEPERAAPPAEGPEEVIGG